MRVQEPPGDRQDTTADRRARLARLERLVRLMDDGARLPGTSVRFGLDGVIGLIPGIGDLFGAVVSLYVLAEAHQLGAPRPLLARMLINLLADGLLGSVPLLGDVFDVAWKANRRNLRLLCDHLERSHPAAR